MSGPRLTAPAAKVLCRSLSTTAPVAVPKTATHFTSSKVAAPLARKYAELLGERSHDADHNRHLTTRSANRPHPPPRRVRLMQTFSSSSSRPRAVEQHSIDYAVLPSWESLQAPQTDSASRLRVPLLPDNFLAHHAPEASDAPLPMPEISVVAADPENVSISALTEVEGMGIDGVELKFAHEGPVVEREPGMLTDLWKGLVDDVLGEQSHRKLAV
ncbi:hypothetical protein BX600DRAFT_237636 [Xylariales sp. PMI_506]|nr:hypothetical protein BX600DRAFT_237636 [Xylariales sp. PMI_506]